MWKYVLVPTLLALSGCAGSLVCEWESQEEKMEKVLHETVPEILREQAILSQPR